MSGAVPLLPYIPSRRARGKHYTFTLKHITCKWTVGTAGITTDSLRVRDDDES